MHILQLATQIDIPEGKKSGLVHAVRILDGVEGIAVCKLTDKDVVRHPLVMRIIRAYEKDYEEAERRGKEREEAEPLQKKKRRTPTDEKGENER